MRKFLALLCGLALALWVPTLPALGQGSSIGPPSFIVCNQNTGATLAIAGATTTIKLVSGATTPVGPGGVAPSIYICGVIVTAAATSTYQLEFGTGTLCATGLTTLTPPMNVSTTPTLFHTTNPSFIVPAGKDLCIVSGAAGINGILFFAQF